MTPQVTFGRKAKSDSRKARLQVAYSVLVVVVVVLLVWLLAF